MAEQGVVSEDLSAPAAPRSPDQSSPVLVPWEDEEIDLHTNLQEEIVPFFALLQSVKGLARKDTRAFSTPSPPETETTLGSGPPAPAREDSGPAPSSTPTTPVISPDQSPVASPVDEAPQPTS